MSQLFARSEILLGEENMQKLHRAKVLVFGLGGVGGYAVEALARAGVGELHLVDNDTVSVTNRNRQLYALSSTVGRLKTEVAKERVLDINPDCKVRTYPVFYLPENADTFDFSKYDYVVDAVDTVTAKLEIAVRAHKASVPVISCMGTGNKLNGELFTVCDIQKTTVCPLARAMRRELKKRDVTSLKVVYSTEQPLTPSSTEEESGKRQTPGTVSFVPPIAGFLLAGEIIKDLIAK